ncbi:MAG: glycosyltransferase [Rhizobiaceae bacterium]|nr:glycosyltransferase [Rhizobiaceae bacterium]
MTKRVLFYVQHLWGVGHVYRATRIAHGLKRAGFQVHLVWGGTKLPGFDFDGLELHYLTPVRTSDASFSELLHANGALFTDLDKEDRKNALLSLFDKIRPDVLITEAFPFGRRQMRFELVPLLERAKSLPTPPLIVSSIRDIMQEDRKASRVEESNEFVAKYFDLILVHGDQNLIRIEETLQGTETFSAKIRYTGLVTPHAQQSYDESDKTNVLVSVGGGAFGKNLLMTALEAFPHVKKYKDGWKITTGTEMPENAFQEIKRNAPEGIEIVRHIPDMVAVLRSTAISVSHSGYNTVGDILRAGCASILYPYVGGRETEQLRRAEIMERSGIAKMIHPDDFSPVNLAAAIDEVSPRSTFVNSLDMDGADKTPQIIKAELK